MRGKNKFTYDQEDAEGLTVISAEDAAVPSEPRSLARHGVLACRRLLLQGQHIRPLAEYAAKLREEGRGLVPDFDPMDGGVDARLLFLLEKPGPMTDPERKVKTGSGFCPSSNDLEQAA